MFLAVVEDDAALANLDGMRAWKEVHAAVADHAADLGEEPELHARIDLRAAVADRHVRAGALATDRRLDRGVAAADDEEARAEVGVRLVKVMTDVRQVFAGDAEEPGSVHRADGEHDLVDAI